MSFLPLVWRGLKTRGPSLFWESYWNPTSFPAMKPYVLESQNLLNAESKNMSGCRGMGHSLGKWCCESREPDYRGEKVLERWSFVQKLERSRKDGQRWKRKLSFIIPWFWSERSEGRVYSGRASWKSPSNCSPSTKLGGIWYLQRTQQGRSVH